MTSEISTYMFSNRQAWIIDINNDLKKGAGELFKQFQSSAIATCDFR